MSKHRRHPPRSVDDAATGVLNAAGKTPPSSGMPAQHKEEIEKSLEAIYKNDAGDMPDLTKFDPIRSRWWMYAAAAAAVFVVVLISAAWAGFAFFKPFRGFAGQGLTVTIEGSEHVSIGEENVYFVNYQNQTSDPIASAELRVTFPSDFIVTETEPRPEGDGLSWRLGSIPVDGHGTIRVKGAFTGALGTQTAIQVIGTYRPASFNSDFESLATKMLSYDQSVLVGAIAAPAKVLPGDHVTLKYGVGNQGQDTISGLEARITLPDGFQRDATSTDAIDGQTVRIPVGTLAAGSSTAVTVSGTFTTGVSGDVKVVAEAGRLGSDGSFLPNQHSEATFTVLAGDLSLKLVVNGTDADTTVQYGGALRFGIGYQNTSPEDLKGVKLRLRLDPVSTSTVPAFLVDWKGYEDNASGTRKGDVVSWDKAAIPSFESLPPQEEGTIDLLTNAVGSASGTSGLAFRAVLEADVASVGDTAVNRTVRSTPIVIQYLSDADIAVEARYFSEEGAPLGSGPLPPLVGQKTTYRVSWTLSKHFHELKDVKVTATLPKGVSWPGNVIADAGDVSFDPASQTVTWTLNRMPEDVKNASAEFDVALTPSAADADRFAQILNETKFEATDNALNQPVLRTWPTLTTDLQNDDGARGKGVVRR